MAVAIFSACSEETFDGVDRSQLPNVDDIDAVIEVDQETNQVTMRLNNTGVYPVWKVYTKANPVISTNQVYKDIVVNQGDYQVEVQMGNRNGVCEGVKTYTFHIENTKVDFSPYMRRLTDNASKTWHIDGDTKGHLGCGPSGTDGLEWWNADPNNKAEYGVYDNLMIFTDNGGVKEGEYTFDTSATGTIYVNTGITEEPYGSSNTGDGLDYLAPAQTQNTTFEFVPEGSDLYLVFPAGTLMGYLPNIQALNNPKFKVNSITAKEIQLTNDNGEIAWHYILAVPGEKVPVFEGFKYDSEFNLWKNANIEIASTFFADANWGGIDQPEVDLTDNKISLHTPAALGGTQWQGQVHVKTDIVLSANTNYDFSIWVNAPADSKITVKPHPDGDDNTYLYADVVSFTADGSCFYLSDVPGFDGTLVLTLDFAGNPDMDFEISKIVIKDHANDDGTVLPAEPEAPKCTWVDVNSDDNLWKGISFTEGEFPGGYTTWTSEPGWGGNCTEPDMVMGDNNYSVFYPEAPGGDQWMAQVKLRSGILMEAEQAYDIRVTLVADNDVSKATVKVVDTSDAEYYYDNRFDLPADEEVVVEYVNMTGKTIDTLMFAFDFGGISAGTTVVIKDIIVQTHRD